MKALSILELEARYDDFLDETYGDVPIGGYSYTTSRALYSVDPTAYDVGFADWLDAECTNETLFEKNGEYYSENPDDESEAV